jgi:hypothetical protein
VPEVVIPESVLGAVSVPGPVPVVPETVPSVTVATVVPWLSVADMLPCVGELSVPVPDPLGSPVVMPCIVALPVPPPLLLALSLAELVPSSPQLEIKPSATPKPTTRL